MHDNLSVTRHILKKALAGTNTASVFLIGSQSKHGVVSSYSHLSDIDLLASLEGNSLDQYEQNLKLMFLLRDTLRKHNLDVDLFYLSRNILPIYTSCLSVILGMRTIEDAQLIFGNSLMDDGRDTSDRELVIKRSLYKAECARRIRMLQDRLPDADTEYTRHVAKMILRTLKVICCVVCPLDQLEVVEAKLLSSKSFDSVLIIYNAYTDDKLELHVILRNALTDKKITDWPAWMIAQEKFITWLLERKDTFDKSEVDIERRFDSAVKVRNMLLIDLHTILDATDHKERNKQIGDYADKTASLLVRIAINGIPKLGDLESSDIPSIVKESYNIIVKHLQRQQPTLRCLAASIVLLEYALGLVIENEVHFGE